MLFMTQEGKQEFEGDPSLHAGVERLPTLRIPPPGYSTLLPQCGVPNFLFLCLGE